MTTLLAIDGNSLLHRGFHGSPRADITLPGGGPGWAVRRVLHELQVAVDRCAADRVVVGFDDPDSSVRRDRWPQYKAQRPDKLGPLRRQLDGAVDVLRDLGVVVVVPSGLEADDVLASAAAHASATGTQCVLVSSDRDAFALIGPSTRLLRIADGGAAKATMLDTHRLRRLTGVDPVHYPDLAALRGDPSDNLSGVPGIGARTAARLLAEFTSAAAAFEAAVEDPQRCSRVVGAAVAATLATGEARQVWQRNRDVMAMESGVPLGLHPGAGQLPLAQAQVARVYGHFDLAASSAVRSLCRTSPPPPPPEDADPGWRPARPRRSWRRLPPLPKPVFRQEALF